ncbi:MAG: PAS domain-containing protein, partial [Chloroflexota bacterium]|nr:PAS domain-containing protein [Chloroflexota bacterium]
TQLPASKPRSVEELYQAWTLRRYAPPRLLVDENYNVTHIFGNADKYLREREGAVTHNILHKVLPELRLDLRAALYHAFHHGERTDSRLLQVRMAGESCLIQLHVGPVAEPGFPHNAMEIVFEERQSATVVGLPTGETVPTDEDYSLIARLEEELLRTRERLQMIIEDHEGANQELKTSNEELQSINEEMKSTTEELETSKEELQSMNEELVTVNHELKLKIDEISRANSDLLNLIAATDVGSIFLDQTLHIQRFTPRATDLFNLINGDIGRPFAHISYRIHRGKLAEEAARVLATLEPFEEVVQSDDERWYILRLFPYRTVDQRVDGVVITFVDISDFKRAESELQQRIQQQAVAELGRQALREGDPAALMQAATRRVAEILNLEFCHVLTSEANGERLRLTAGVGWPADVIDQMVNTEPDSPTWHTLRTEKPVIIEDIAQEVRFRYLPLLGEQGIVSSMMVAIPGPDQVYGVLGAHSTQPRSFTDYEVAFLQGVANLIAATIARHTTEEALRRSEEQLRLITDNVPGLIAYVDADERYQFANRGYETWFGLTPEGVIGRPIRDVLGETVYANSQIHVQKVLAGGRTSFENRLTRPDGSSSDLLVTYVPQQPVAGRIPGFYVLGMDITERKAAETALRTSQQLLQGSLDALTSHIAILDRHGTILQVNAAWRRFGEHNDYADNHDGPGTNYLHICATTDGAQAAAGIQALIEGKRTFFELEYPCHSPDERRWFVMRVTRFGEGEGLRIVVAHENVTERRKAEDALRQSEAFSRALLENSPDCVEVLDLDGNLLDINGPGRLMTDIDDLAPLLGHAWTQLWADPTPVQRALESAQAGNVGQFQVFNPTAKGTPKWWEGLVTRVAHPGGQDDRLLAVLRDVTERKREEEAQSFLANLGEQISRSDEPEDLLWTILCATAEHLQVSRAFFSEVELAQGTITVQLDYHTDLENLSHRLPSLAGSHRIADYGSEDVASLNAGRTVINHDLNTDTVNAAVYADFYQPLQVRAYVCVPVRRENRWVGNLFVSSHEARTWSESEIRLLQVVAERGWLAVERARNEHDLRLSEQHLQQLADAMPQIVWRSNADGIIEYLNQQWLDYTGLTLEASLADANWAIHPDDQEAALSAWLEDRPKGQPYTFEMRLRRWDGIYCWHLARCVPVRNSEDKIINWFGTSTDIDNRKQAELNQQFLVELSAEIRLLEDPAAIEQTIVRAVGLHLDGNRCQVDVIDVAADRVTVQTEWRQDEAKPSLLGAYALSAYMLPALIADAQAGRTITVHDVTTDTRTAAVATNFAAVGVAAFIVVPICRNERWVGVFDVSDRTERTWRSEEVALLETVVNQFWPLIEKARAEQALRHNEAQLRLITDNVPGLIAYIDCDERYQFVNLAYASWFNLPTEQIVGRSLRELISAATYAQAQPYIAGVLAGQAVSFETSTQRHGLPVTFTMRYTPQVSSAGQVVGFYTLSTDITERKQEEATQRFLAELGVMIQQGDNVEGVLGAVTAHLGAHLGVQRALFAEVDEAEATLTVQRDYHANLPSVQGCYPISAFSAETQAAVRAGQTVIVTDAQHDLRTQAYYADTYGPQAMQAYVAVPLHGAGGWAGTLTVSSDQLRTWTAREIALLQTVAQRTWLAVENVRLFQVARANEERYTELFENANDIVYTLDMAGNLLSLNRAGERIIGFPRRDLIGKSIAPRITPASLARMVQAFQNKVDGAKITVYELEVLTHDQQIVTLEISSRLLYSGETPIGVQGIGRNITERKVTEAALRDVQERLATALAAGQIGTWMWDIIQDRLVADAAFARLFGVPPAEAAAGAPLATYLQAIHAEDRTHIEAAMWQAVKEQGAYATEYRVYTASGELRWVAARGRVEYDEAGEPVRFAGAVVDITKRKAIERNREFLSELDIELRPLADADEIAWTTVRRLGEYLTAERCLFAEVDGDDVIIEHDYTAG